MLIPSPIGRAVPSRQARRREGLEVGNASASVTPHPSRGVAFARAIRPSPYWMRRIKKRGTSPPRNRLSDRARCGPRRPQRPSARWCRRRRRKKVSGDVAEAPVAAGFGQRADDRVRRGAAEQMFHQSGVARRARRRRLHAAARGVTQQRRDAGRPGHADAHRILDAKIAQPLDPADDGGRIEAELRDDLDRQPALLRGLDLVGERQIEPLPPESADDRRDARRCRCR